MLTIIQGPVGSGKTTLANVMQKSLGIRKFEQGGARPEAKDIVKLAQEGKDVIYVLNGPSSIHRLCCEAGLSFRMIAITKHMSSG